MEYRIDREALASFVARQVDLVEAGSIPKLLADVVELRLRHESISRDEVRALWLGAGLATQAHGWANRSSGRGATSTSAVAASSLGPRS